MEKRFDHTKYEEKIYQMWEKANVFTPKIDKKKKPFSIILPLPNANDPMHMGHALFTIEDILARYHRMLGEPTLWLPGGDHAGIETQFVFEKHLSKKGKSRFDYDRDTLYKMIWDFAQKNKDLNKDQMKRLGFSLDWSRYHYSLEAEIVEKVLKTFKKMYEDGLVYRGLRIVNYCTHCGTAFSDLEVDHKERKDFLYYLDYGTIKIATTRPETIFADVAVAVNPKDKRYRSNIDKDATIPLIKLDIPIISDLAIDKDFGTGALKVTPAHDATDFEIGEKNNLEVISIFDLNGIMKKNPRVPKELWGLTINKAREKSIEMLERANALIKKEPLIHNVGVCYRCGTVIEPMVMPQWFVKTKQLAEPAIKAVKEGKTKIFPKKRFEKLFFDWMENIKDWNISRQIVWGPRIPVWYNVEGYEDRVLVTFLGKNNQKQGKLSQFLEKGYKLSDIKSSLQQITVPVFEKSQENVPFIVSTGEPKSKGRWIQETDTFDTWFLSGQWPLTTLGFNVDSPEKSSEDFKYFYPTSVMDTLWDILYFWVGRMMMFGLYLAKDVPFKVVHIHARVVDKHGRKMSKSKGNVINPIEMVDKYGADALRMALVMGVAPASDIAISDEKIKGMRNFANKLWNISRFISMKLDDVGIKKYDELPGYNPKNKSLNRQDKTIIKKLEKLVKSTTAGLDKYKFGIVTENLYDFIWHEFADIYIESTKDRLVNKDTTPLIVLRHVLFNCLKLLHPFMPFVTEAIWQEMKMQRKYANQPLINSSWPNTN